MKRKCPFCNTYATYPHNLRTHLTGKYPGHSMAIDKAERIANEVFSVRYIEKPQIDTTATTSHPILSKEEPFLNPESRTFYDAAFRRQEVNETHLSNGFQYFIEELLESLVQNKKLPKYQFERRIDAILHLFLPDLLTQHFGHEVETLVAEFPLKKEGNRQSTNVDYLMVMRDSDNFIKYWLFFELKTDDSSVEAKQIDIYESAMYKRMPTLISDIHEIMSGTTAVSKYMHLLERLKFIPDYDRTPIRVIYLSPTIPTRFQYPRQLESARIYPLTFSELEKISVKRFPEAWNLFRKIVIPVLSDTH